MAPLCVIDADGEGAKVELHAGESVWLPGGGGYGGGSKTTAGSGEGVSVRRCGIASCGSFGAAWALDVQAGQRGSATSAMVAVAPREHASPAHIYNEPAECGGSVQLWVLNEVLKKRRRATLHDTSAAKLHHAPGLLLLCAQINF